MVDLKIILASKSPRRQELVKELGLPFEIRVKEVEEIYPDELELHLVPEFLANLKAIPLLKTIKKGEILLTSDTVVIHKGKLLGKPKDEDDAINMLAVLSNSMHEVVTGVCLNNNSKSFAFSTVTKVYFSKLSSDDIKYYVEKFKPFDKAGSYGIQEWIGYVGVKKIDGCYYNVMGLPLHDLYATLKKEFS